MTEIVFRMLPIFTMIGMGGLFVRQGWFTSDGLPVLNRSVMNACISVLLFSGVINGGYQRANVIRLSPKDVLGFISIDAPVFRFTEVRRAQCNIRDPKSGMA